MQMIAQALSFWQILGMKQEHSLTACEIYFGTYTKQNSSEGIYHATLNLKTGTLSDVDLACKIQDPSYLEMHANAKFVYAVTEREQGTVSAFAIEPGQHQLKLINTVSTKGSLPCHLCISRDGRTLLAANYGSGSVASFSINTDGSLTGPISFMQHAGSSVHLQRQEGPHAHSINLSPDNRFAYAADLGIDKVLIYKFDPKSGELSPNQPAEVKIKPGAGPRHLSFNPAGRFAYVINELDETIVVFAHDEQSGALTELQTRSTLPNGFSGASYCAEVRVHPNGKFLYASNRGHDSIVIYTIDPEKGTLMLRGFQNTGIKTPRNFAIDPTGQYCVVGNQDADSVVIFRIDQDTGELNPTDQVAKIGAPICVLFADHDLTGH